MSHHDHDDDHDHDHGHGHHHDQGVTALFRYLRYLPSMWRSDVNRAVVAALAPNDHELVADIGAGMGAGVFPAAKSGARVIAVDPTNYMRAILNLRRLGQRARKRIEVVDGAAENMPIDDGSLDAVMAVNALHHWNDIGAAAREIFRATSAGGRLVLVDEQFRDPDHPDFDRFDDDHEHMFDEAQIDDVVGALTSAGFGDVNGERTTMAAVPVLRFTARRPV